MKSRLLRIDWSENVELYQTQQEKSQYYTTIIARVNAGIMYGEGKVMSVGTISDAKSHKASATMTSIREMLKFCVFSDVKTLYIVFDSPTNHYRNKKMMFLIKNEQ